MDECLWLSRRGRSDSFVDEVLKALAESLTDEGRILTRGVGAIGEEDKDEVVLGVYPEASPGEAKMTVGAG